MADEAILKSVKDYLNKLTGYGFQDLFGVLFGSFVNGRNHEWSDIDLIVVSPSFDNKCSISDSETLWITAAETDPRIEPIPCGLKQWQEDDSSAIIDIARREGVEVRL